MDGLQAYRRVPPMFAGVGLTASQMTGARPQAGETGGRGAPCVAVHGRVGLGTSGDGFWTLPGGRSAAGRSGLAGMGGRADGCPGHGALGVPGVPGWRHSGEGGSHRAPGAREREYMGTEGVLMRRVVVGGGRGV